MDQVQGCSTYTSFIKTDHLSTKIYNKTVVKVLRTMETNQQDTSSDISNDDIVVTETSFETAVSNEAAKKNKNLKWDKLPKYTQWKLFKTYMHDNEITDGLLFKRMKSMISEKRTDAFVTYDVATQKVINVDFKHEVFIRERSKKKKLQVQLAQASEEQKVKQLEDEINGLSILPDTVEVVEEEVVHVEV